MVTNEELVASGLRLFRTPLSRFVCEALLKEFGDTWWTDGVLETLVHDRMPTVDDVRRFRKLPADGTIEECADAMDMAVCLVLLTKHWPRVFRQMFGADHRGWAYELIGVRNENKHLVGIDHPSDYAWRALDTMYRLCDSIDQKTASEVLKLRSSVDLSAYGQMATGSSTPEVYPTPKFVGPVRDTVPATPWSTELDVDLSIVGPDFAGADLRGMDFEGANLAGVDFTDADLRRANLTGADLTGAIFGRTRFSDEHGNAVVLQGATLDKATLNFAGADLRYVDLSGLDLHGADFTGADLRRTDLTGANLTGAIFGRTRFSDQHGNAVAIQGAVIDGATLNFTDTDLRYVDFSAMDLRGADFTGADLRRADLTSSILRGKSLKGARLTDAVTTNTTWT